MVIAGYCFARATLLFYTDNGENADTVCQNKKAYQFLPSALKFSMRQALSANKRYGYWTFECQGSW